MALPASLSFSTCFNFKVDPKKFNLTDTTNYALEGIALADVRGLFKITDPTGTVVYENTGFAASDFSAPDIDADVLLDFNTVDLPLDSNDEVIKGNYKIEYKVDVAGAVQPGVYDKVTTYSYSFTTPCLKLDLSYDCEDATVTSVDSTDYGSLLTSITRTHTLTPPTGTPTLTPTVSALATVVASPISTKTWTAELDSDVLFTTADGLLLKFLLEGTAEVVVDCGVATCDLAQCLFELKKQYDDLKCQNSTKAAQALKDLQEATLTYELYRAALGCGNIEQAEVYRKEIFSCSCTSGCSTCTGCDDNCTGCETCNGLPVVINPGSISIIAGPSGPQGPTGADGSKWYVGTGVPLVGLGVDNDMFLDDATGDVYQKQTGTWTLVDNITGPTGPPGTNGTAFEYFDNQVIDLTWVDATDTPVTSMTHTPAATDDYEVHVNLINTYADSANGTIKLKVNGVTQLTWGPLIQNGITTTYQTDSFVWRGNVVSGQAITVEVNKTGAPNISTKNFSWLINKSQ